jgi:hypothetical protein
MDCYMKAEESPNIKINHWRGSINEIVNHIPARFDITRLRKLYEDKGLVERTTTPSAFDRKIDRERRMDRFRCVSSAGFSRMKSRGTNRNGDGVKSPDTAT